MIAYLDKFYCWAYSLIFYGCRHECIVQLNWTLPRFGCSFRSSVILASALMVVWFRVRCLIDNWIIISAPRQCCPSLSNLTWIKFFCSMNGTTGSIWASFYVAKENLFGTDARSWPAPPRVSFISCTLQQVRLSPMMAMYELCWCGICCSSIPITKQLKVK